MLKDVDLQAWSATLYRFCFSCRSSLGGFELRPRVAGAPGVTRATRVELQIIQVHFSKLDSPVLFFLYTWLRRHHYRRVTKGLVVDTILQFLVVVVERGWWNNIHANTHAIYFLSPKIQMKIKLHLPQWTFSRDYPMKAKLHARGHLSVHSPHK